MDDEQTPAHYIFISKLINTHKLEIGVEIGVWKGGLTMYVLDHCPTLKKWYAVDPYKKWTPEEYTDRKNKTSQMDFDKIYADLKSTLNKKYKDRCILYRNTSEEGSRLITDPIDLVFIDANHAYEWVRQDIALWAPKVRPGGIVSGHDYRSDRWGVKRAVDEFVGQNKLTCENGPGRVWYYQQPVE